MSSFCKKLLTFFFSKNISIYALFNDQSFNATLTKNTVSFEQLGPDIDLSRMLMGNKWNNIATQSTLKPRLNSNFNACDIEPNVRMRDSLLR